MGRLRKAGRLVRKHGVMLVCGTLATLIVGAAALTFVRLGSDATFQQRIQILESTLLGFGLLSVWLLIAQLRQTSAWNRVLSYHEYFGELPSRDRVNQLYLCLHRLGLHEPTYAAPLTRKEARMLWDDNGIEGGDGTYHQVGQRVLREYLNDFEEFCGAIRACVVNEDYARELEGDRTINAYYGFEEIIKIIRDEAATSGRRDAGAQQGEAMARTLQLYRRKPYQELRIVARTWRKRREKEYRALAKKRRSYEKSLEDHEGFDGVGPST